MTKWKPTIQIMTSSYVQDILFQCRVGCARVSIFDFSLQTRPYGVHKSPDQSIHVIQSQTKPSESKPSQAIPNRARPSQAKPSEAGLD